ncbi:MAG: hypothetical protein GX100_04580 [candidate division WS1 bacterium]|jgi:hypothetical protein|nr:hypothetical protein [candidate division WS1 bacterium]
MAVFLIPVRNLIKQHGKAGADLQEIVISGKGKQESEATLREVLARSQKYARATVNLLDSGHWEAAALIVRAVWEDTAVLGYIHAKGPRKKQYAALYKLSFALQQERMQVTLDQCGATDRFQDDRESARQRRALDERVKQFEKLRADLWEGARKPDGTPKCKNTWNGLTIRDTWEQASLQSPYTYVMHYMSLCPYVHSDSLSFASGGFATEFGIADPQEEAQETATVAVRLLLALWLQLVYLKDTAAALADLEIPPEDQLEKAASTICTSAGMAKAETKPRKSGLSSVNDP